MTEMRPVETFDQAVDHKDYPERTKALSIRQERNVTLMAVGIVIALIVLIGTLGRFFGDDSLMLIPPNHVPTPTQAQ